MTTLIRRGGGEQKLMSANARKRHIKGLYTPNGSICDGEKGKRYLLFDDVTTTGATVRACAEILRDSGIAKSVRVLTLANTNLKTGDKKT